MAGLKRLVRPFGFVAVLLCGSWPVAVQEVRSTPATPLVIGETFTISSSILKEVRRINVYLPPDYTAAADVRLPVLYMPDGGIAEDFLHVAGLVQVSTGNGTMRPFVLVGIENTERRRDMTGPTDDPEDRKIAPRVGGSAAFRAFIRDELMPEIRRRYRTAPEAAIIGESLAGLFILETLLVEPQLFDTYIAFDASLWWNRSRLVSDAASLLRKRGARPARLYLSSSNERELAALNARFASVIGETEPAGLAVRYVPMPDESHATIYHPAALRALRTLFPPEKK